MMIATAERPMLCDHSHCGQPMEEDLAFRLDMLSYGIHQHRFLLLVRPFRLHRSHCALEPRSYPRARAAAMSAASRRRASRPRISTRAGGMNGVG